jgi:S-adenosylmethionine-dependent methyltransferase
VGQNGLHIESVAGIRIFQDYVRQAPEKASDQAALLALEKQYCQQDPHWRLGRYLLYTVTKPEADV